MSERTHADVGTYYDQPLADIPEATGAGLIWFMGRDHLSPPLSNDDRYALYSANWREASSIRVVDLARSMGMRVGQTALELGCGIGGPGRDIAAATGAHVVGISISKEQLRNLRIISEKIGSAYRSVGAADMRHLPFRDGAFDHTYIPLMPYIT